MYGKIKAIKYRTGYLKDFDIARLKNVTTNLLKKNDEFNEKDFESSTNRIVKYAIESLEKSAVDENGIVESKEVRYHLSMAMIYHGYYNVAKEYIEYHFIKALKEKDDKIEDLTNKLAIAEEKLKRLSA